METKYINISSKLILVLLLAILPISISPGNVHAAPGDITRISVDSSGVQANNDSKHSVVSGDGRYIAFESGASNLVPGDTNGAGDVFVHDRQTGITTRVSVDSSGAQANAWSGSPAISNDGRFVAFYSDASNLVAGDTNGFGDIFVHDRQTGTTTRVSVESSGAEANGTASDFYFDTSISGDGRYVAFQSEANNLVAGDTNGANDIFVHDRQTGVTIRVSVDSSGVEANTSSRGPKLSSDGRYVVFASGATNLVAGDTNSKGDIFMHDRQTGATTRVSVNSSGEQADGGGSSPAISGDGRYVAFLSKSNNLAAGAEDYEALVYVHDRQSGQTSLASVYSNEEIMVGTLDEPSISSNGRYVAFSFYERGNGQGLQEIFVRDLQLGEAIQATHGGASSEDSSFRPTLSADGSIVTFWSFSNTLVSEDTNGFADVFVYEVFFASETALMVFSILQDCPRGCTSAADPIVDYTVTFSEPVTGVTADDFVLTTSGALTGTSIAGIIGSGPEYIVAVNTGNGTGTLRLDVSDNDSIVDSTGNPLGGMGAGNGDFTSVDVYTVDRSTPIATSILRADPNPTAAGSVRYTVAFSESVNGVDAGDFALTSTCGIAGTSITAVSGSGTGYTVNISTGTGEGTLWLDLLDNDSIVDEVGNALGGSGANNGNFLTGEIYTLDRNAPFVTISLPADPNPTAADSVRFTVGFTEPVSGVDASDFGLSTTGDITSAAITSVSGSGSVYTVVTGTGSGSGTMRLDVIDNDSIVDALGNPLGGTGPSNGNFSSGTAYSVNKVPVNLMVEQLRSNGNNDGWILEAGENSEQGGFRDSNASTFVLGDNAQNNQFRAVLDFPTQYLPNNAVITRVLLMIRQEGLVGTDPFTTHQNITVDIRSGAFGFIGPFKYRGLQVSDFQSPSDRDAVGVIENSPFNGWYWSYLDSSSFAYINRYGSTQLRLRFQVDDDNDFSDDYLRFYSGDYEGLANRPRLLVEYYIPR